MNHINEIVQVRLALLAASEHRAVGPPPAAEELAALYDHRLDDTRRAQVISHLAADAELYAEWDALQRSVVLFDSARAERDPRERPVSWLGRFADWLMQPVMAAVAATALLLAVIVPLSLSLSPLSNDVDNYYDLAGQVNQAAFSSPKAIGPPTQAQKSTSRQLVEQGLRSGLERLGHNLSLPGLPRAGLEDIDLWGRLTLAIPSRRARFELGRLTAVAYVQCHAALETTDYAGMVRDYTVIREQLSASSGLSDADRLEHALANAQAGGNSQYNACVTASRVVAWLQD